MDFTTQPRVSLHGYPHFSIKSLWAKKLRLHYTPVRATVSINMLSKRQSFDDRKIKLSSALLESQFNFPAAPEVAPLSDLSCHQSKPDDIDPDCSAESTFPRVKYTSSLRTHRNAMIYKEKITNEQESDVLNYKMNRSSTVQVSATPIAVRIQNRLDERERMEKTLSKKQVKKVCFQIDQIDSVRSSALPFDSDCSDC